MGRFGPIARVLLVLASVLLVMYALTVITAGGR